MKPSPVSDQAPTAQASAPAARRVSLAHLSLIACDCPALVRIAGAAGFDCVDLRLAPATPTDRAYSASQRFAVCRELLPMLRDTGVRVWDVEIVRIDAQTEPQAQLPLMEAAALLGARRLKVVADIEDESRIMDALSRLCELAAPLGLTVDLEYMVFSGVKSLEAALRIVRAAARPNLRVLVDALHWMRAGDSLAGLRAAGSDLLGYVQLCDGPLQGPGTRELLLLEARTRRLSPGAGEFPLADLLRVMPRDCVLSLEVPLPPGCEALAHARQLLQSTRALLQHTLESPSIP